MGPSDLFLHAVAFLAPAAFLAFALPLLGRLVLRATGGRTSWWLQVAMVFLAGAAVQSAGLWWFGADGRMATYGAVVVAAATAQWLAVRAWR